MLKSDKNRKMLEREEESLKEIKEKLDSVLKNSLIDESNYRILEDAENSIRLLKGAFLTRLMNLIRQGEEKVAS